VAGGVRRALASSGSLSIVAVTPGRSTPDSVPRTPRASHRRVGLAQDLAERQDLGFVPMIERREEDVGGLIRCRIFSGHGIVFGP